VIIDFIDVVGEGTDAKQTLASTAELKTLGDFKETVSLEGDQVLIRAQSTTATGTANVRRVKPGARRTRLSRKTRPMLRC